MASFNQKTGKYSCVICGDEFITSLQANSHMLDKHDPIYLIISTEEANKLIHYFNTGDYEYIPTKFVLRLKKAMQNKIIRKPDDEMFDM